MKDCHAGLDPASTVESSARRWTPGRARGDRLLLLLVGAALCVAASAQPDATRQRELVRMVRQDCGSCHGMHLTGGLGPALTAARLGDWPLEALEATIRNGRPGTPMPGWAPMLSAEEARWIARQLQLGFPQEAR
ncbi:c-type cytochrome [Ramlibacter albus]|uniref:Cytochrome c n=1 Tax=Ramlibacter albus TaxID=2079448 RepID=A0A923MA12_9BURK|nr:cytochrome c [Ramlibacter albus]MBC5765643.1 cytochrome c [Ramlibacter albus]